MLRCPRCGAPAAPPGRTGSLCPGCLLASLLGGGDDEGPLDADEAWLDIPYDIVTVMARDDDSATYLARPLGIADHVVLTILGPREDAPAIAGRARAWQPRLSQLRNPHIARLLDAGPAADGCVYLAADYIAGPTLAAPACREALTAAARRAVVDQLTFALDALHARGLAHLKLDASRVKISDRDGVHAALIGVGTGLIVDGLACEPARDLDALHSLARQLGVER